MLNDNRLKNKSRILLVRIFCNTNLIKQIKNKKYVQAVHKYKRLIMSNYSYNDFIITKDFHIGKINALIKLSDTLIASCGEDSSIKIWDCYQGVCIETLQNNETSVTSIVKLRGHFIAGASYTGNSIRIWNYKSGETILPSSLQKYLEPILHKFHPTIICISSLDEPVEFFNFQSLQFIKRFHTRYVTSIIRLKNNQVATVHGNGNIYIWDYSKPDKQFLVIKGDVGFKMFSLVELDDFQIAGGNMKLIKIYDYKKLNNICKLKGHDGKVVSIIRVNFNAEQIISGSLDKTVKVWNYKKKTCLKTFEGNLCEINCLLSFNDFQNICENRNEKNLNMSSIRILDYY